MGGRGASSSNKGLGRGESSSNKGLGNKGNKQAELNAIKEYVNKTLPKYITSLKEYDINKKQIQQLDKIKEEIVNEMNEFRLSNLNPKIFAESYKPLVFGARENNLKVSIKDDTSNKETDWIISPMGSISKYSSQDGERWTSKYYEG